MSIYGTSDKHRNKSPLKTPGVIFALGKNIRKGSFLKQATSLPATSGDQLASPETAIYIYISMSDYYCYLFYMGNTFLYALVLASFIGLFYYKSLLVFSVNLFLEMIEQCADARTISFPVND